MFDLIGCLAWVVAGFEFCFLLTLISLFVRVLWLIILVVLLVPLFDVSSACLFLFV